MVCCIPLCGPSDKVFVSFGFQVFYGFNASLASTERPRCSSHLVRKSRRRELWTRRGVRAVANPSIPVPRVDHRYFRFPVLTSTITCNELRNLGGLGMWQKARDGVAAEFRVD